MDLLGGKYFRRGVQDLLMCANNTGLRTINQTIQIVDGTMAEIMTFNQRILQIQRLSSELQSVFDSVEVNDAPPIGPQGLLFVCTLVAIVFLTIGISETRNFLRAFHVDIKSPISAVRAILEDTGRKSRWGMSSTFWIGGALLALVLSSGLALYIKAPGTSTPSKILVDISSNIDDIFISSEQYSSEIAIVSSRLMEAMRQFDDDYGFISTFRHAMIDYTSTATNYESQNSLSLQEIILVTSKRSQPLRTLSLALSQSRFLNQIPRTEEFIGILNKIIEMRTTLDIDMLRLLDKMYLADTHFINNVDALRNHIRNGQTPLALHAIGDHATRQKEHARRLADILLLAFEVKSMANEAQDLLMEISTTLNKEGKKTNWQKYSSWLQTTVGGMTFAYLFPSSSIYTIIATLLSNLIVEHQYSNQQDVISSSNDLTTQTEPHLFNVETVAKSILLSVTNITAQIEVLVQSSSQAEIRFADVEKKGDYDVSEIKYLEAGLDHLAKALERKRDGYSLALVRKTIDAKVKDPLKELNQFIEERM